MGARGGRELVQSNARAPHRAKRGHSGHDTWVGAWKLVAKVEPFLPVGHAVRKLPSLCEPPLPRGAWRSLPHINNRLFSSRLVEERAGRSEEALEQGVIHAVILDIEEAFVLARAPQRLYRSAVRRGIARLEERR